MFCEIRNQICDMHFQAYCIVLCNLYQQIYLFYMYVQAFSSS